MLNTARLKIYLDTSVISAMFDERTPERMEFTKSAWKRLKDCEVFISDTVIDELKNSPPPLRNKMLSLSENFTVLPVSKTAIALAKLYVEQNIFPAKYFDDAVHVAVAAANQIGILLSWNFTHLVKVKTRRMVALINSAQNYIPVEIISPPEL
ncbi:MAG: PIN domain-containing protein [Candidatus Margulisbacteria bacterium]|jgi:predicted nucleic acid-binding protein|nr:PIN domain-containing protein [Candidatus Margulisiibacteriota bacterium]